LSTVGRELIEGAQKILNQCRNYLVYVAMELIEEAQKILNQCRK
jgi:hypothetical protein